MWPFKKAKKEHKIQYTNKLFGPLREATVNRLDNGLVYFVCVGEKYFIGEDNKPVHEHSAEHSKHVVCDLLPLTWPIDEPCPLFKETT